MYETFDWTNLITKDDRSSIAEDIRSIIEQGDYYKNAPKYQTTMEVFSIKKPHWSKLRMSFYWSCFAFHKGEVSIKHLKSWGVITSSKWAEDRENLWHHHAWYANATLPRLSGIFYIELPEENLNDLECGTEFAPVGTKNSKRFWVPPLIGHWVIYPAELFHRPGILKSEKERIVVAADLGWEE